MAIESIDIELCNGCGICEQTCTEDVIRIDIVKEKAVIQYPQDCRSCALCEYECPQDAIYVSPTRTVVL